MPYETRSSNTAVTANGCATLTYRPPKCEATCNSTGSSDALLYVTQTYDKFGAKLSKSPSFVLYADQTNSTTSSGYASVPTTSLGFIVPKLLTTPNITTTDDVMNNVDELILSGQYFAWGNPQAVGSLSVVEFQVDPWLRTVPLFFTGVYFWLDAQDLNGKAVRVENSADPRLERAPCCLKQSTK